MSVAKTIKLYIGNAIPHGNTKESTSILKLWHQLQGFFQHRQFATQSSSKCELKEYSISMNVNSLLAAMEKAMQDSGNFDNYLQAHVQDETKSIAATLLFTVESAAKSPAGPLENKEVYEVTTLFLQQLVIAINLVLPGAFQVLQASFKGEGAYLFEVQSFDSRIYHGALENLNADIWSQPHNLGFAAVWDWLERAGVSQTHTAIKGINKVLFTMLKVAEQRSEYSARTVLLVLYQLEMLLDCRDRLDASRLRNRARLVLGKLPEEEVDCINELYTIRDDLFLGSHPVHRPPLISHDTNAEFRDRLGQHDTAVELGTALTLVLLQELISQNAQAFVFTESFSCKRDA